MYKPNRHKNHILENESNKFYNNQVPNEWHSDKPEHDYGIDYNTSIVINNQVTGLNFSVQIKSEEKENNKDFSIITLKYSTLRYFNTRLEPILLVSYVREEQEAYWYWFNDLQIDLTSNNKTLNIKIPKTNKLSQINWTHVIKNVQNIFSIKTLVEGIKTLEYTEISNAEILAWKNYYAQDYENAIFYFKTTLKEKKDNTPVLEALTHSLYMKYNYKEALLYVNKLLELSKGANQYLLKASILTEDGIQNNSKGKILEGKKIFKKFIDDSPNHDNYHYNYANALSRLDEYQEAIKYYEICLRINSNNLQAWKNLGGVYNQMQLYDKVLYCYDKALAINPNLKEALFSKGILLTQIYKKHKESLLLMEKAFLDEAEILLSYPDAFFWLAYVNEQMFNIKESLKWINKGLCHFPEDKYFLNFKSRLIIKNWEKNSWIKEEAIDFFQYRFELDNDLMSLFYLFKIQQTNDDDILSHIKKHIPLFKGIEKEDLGEINLNIQQTISFLLHYDKYQVFRKEYPLDRYINQLFSEHYVISTKFWDLLDLIFAYSFSNHVEQYYENDIDNMINVLLNCLSIAPNTSSFLLNEREYTQEEAISILAHISVEFPNVISRESGIQLGYVASKLDLVKPQLDIPEEWYGDLLEKTLLVVNHKLRLLKE
jgi:tetratricopeptide (TPR) repeat protein